MVKKGFSQVEILIVVSLLLVLFSFGTVVFGSFVRKDQLMVESRKIESLVSEAKVKTVAGFSSEGSGALNYGLYFENDRYFLFPGEFYDNQNPKNQEFLLPGSIEIRTIFLPDNSVVFEKISGEVMNYDPAQNFLILGDKQSEEEKKMTINRLGVVEIEDQ